MRPVYWMADGVATLGSSDLSVSNRISPLLPVAVTVTTLSTGADQISAVPWVSKVMDSLDAKFVYVRR